MLIFVVNCHLNGVNAEGLPCRAGIVTGHERMITYCLKRLR